MGEIIAIGLLETLYMTVAATLLAYVIGLPLGVLLVVTDRGGISPKPWLNRVVGVVINIMRSIPFVILMIFVMPLTRMIVGTPIGTTATIVPLVLAAAPFVARMVESSLKEVDGGVIEAAKSMGASNAQIVWRVMLPEARPSLLVGAAIAVTTILSYGAMSGVVGGGGLGQIAINYGYHRSETGVMFVVIVILVVIVQLFQEVGTRWAAKIDKRN